MHPIRAPRRSKGSKPFGTSSRPRPRSIWHGTSGACSRCAFRSLRRSVPTYAPFAEDELRDMLTRHAKLNELPADPARRRRPLLYIGATDVLHGVTDENSVFRGETLTVDQVIHPPRSRR